MTPPPDPHYAAASGSLAIRAVILDVDGTVATCPYDFDAMRAVVADIAARWGLDFEVPRPRGVIEQIDALAARVGDDAAEFRQQAGRAVADLEVAAAGQARLLPGAARALEGLRRCGVSVALITRNCRAASDVVLDGFAAYDLLLTRDDVPRAKPDPDHVRRCLVALAVPPVQAAVVGDHIYDIRAGRTAGVRLCLGVRTGSSPDYMLLDAGADAVIDSVADLPAWLRKHSELSP